ncbi:MAG: response regulator [Mycobacteriales bacterium]
MQVLLVEDVDSQIEAIIAIADAGITFHVAKTRDAAFALLTSVEFDVAVCDMHIPPATGVVADTEHGLAVLTAIRAQSPGTPIIAFTAYKTADVLSVLLEEQRYEDFLGTLNDRAMLTIVEKDALPEFIETLMELAQSIDELNSIEVARGLVQPPLGASMERVVRLYARRKGCALVHAEAMSGGRSGVPVLRLTLERRDGSSGGAAVARIASVPAAIEERRRFEQRVSGALPLGSYAEITGVVQAGAGATGAVFYQVADVHEPLFTQLARSESDAATAVSKLAVHHAVWTAGAPATDESVGEIRRVFMDDLAWERNVVRCGLSPDVVAAVEGVLVLARRSTVHGDMHVGNVLVATDPVLIDFASVARRAHMYGSRHPGTECALPPGRVRVGVRVANGGPTEPLVGIGCIRGGSTIPRVPASVPDMGLCVGSRRP